MEPHEEFLRYIEQGLSFKLAPNMWIDREGHIHIFSSEDERRIRNESTTNHAHFCDSMFSSVWRFIYVNKKSK